MSARPSKRFLFRRLRAELAHETSGIGVDAASADFKNRPFFRTETYLGLDIHLPSLQAGLDRYGDGSRTLGIACDLTDLGALRTGFADVVVTTNTFHHIPAAARRPALTNLIRITRPGGTLFFEATLDAGFAGFLELLRAEFDSVEVSYYKNALSNAYESAFEVGGSLERRIVFSLPFVAFAELLSRFEAMTASTPGGKKHGFIVARRKK